MNAQAPAIPDAAFQPVFDRIWWHTVQFFDCPEVIDLNLEPDQWTRDDNRPDLARAGNPRTRVVRYVVTGLQHKRPTWIHEVGNSRWRVQGAWALDDTFASTEDALIALRAKANLGEPKGMGSLVYADGPCILTAAHVWEAAREKEQFALFFERDKKARLFQTAHMVVRTWPHTWGERWTEWGPDIALIGLPALDTADLRVRDKVFAKLEPFRPNLGDPASSAFWALIGVPQEEVPDPTAAGLGLPVNLYASSLAVYSSGTDLLDYVEVPARHGTGGRPRSYKGISGSGLWRFGMDLSASPRWDGTLWLAGVAYHQLFATPEKPGVIRCHGRKAIDATRLLPPEPPPGDIPLIGGQPPA